MTLTEKVQLWQERVQDPALAQQLQDLVQSGDKEALSDAFYRDLEFGTAGLRGVLGPGTNRMNIYTVGQATQGLVNYLNSLPGEGKSLAICYDSRINSRLSRRLPRRLPLQMACMPIFTLASSPRRL